MAEEGTSPDNFLAFAIGYAQVARRAERSGGRFERTIFEIAAIQQLCIHAVELALKALALSRGWELERSHSIEKLSAEAAGRAEFDWPEIDAMRFKEMDARAENTNYPMRYPAGPWFPSLGEDVVDWTCGIVRTCARSMNCLHRIPYDW